MSPKIALIGIALTLGAAAQDSASLPGASPDPPEKWNLYYQATSVGQTHPGFFALYSGPLSLVNRFEADASLTSTLFFGYLLTRNTQFYFDGELAGGRGFSGTNGIANFPNGEITRAGTTTPDPYIARLFFTHDFGFGEAREAVESDENQLAGSRPAVRYSVTVGKFSATDFFDDNRYSHDPRTQFMAWGIMYNGAWDYPADVHGYTWGWVHEFHTRHWSARYGSFAEPRVANGLRFDHRIFRDHGDAFEGEADFNPHGHPGAVRFLNYLNHTDSGNYAAAIQLAEETHTTPNVTLTRKPGTLKYGFGLSADQELAKGVGVFGRWGWNDGHTESFAFTAIDRLYEAGVSVNGARWHRPHDVAATALAAAGLSAIHAQYLARGGLDFLIGDGALTYGHEIVSETYYSAMLFQGLFAAVDLQHVTNPAYNRDRGPVWIASLRIHIEYGKK